MLPTLLALHGRPPPPAGNPFRAAGFEDVGGGAPALKMITDRRSQKVAHCARRPRAELVWYVRLHVHVVTLPTTCPACPPPTHTHASPCLDCHLELMACIEGEGGPCHNEFPNAPGCSSPFRRVRSLVASLYTPSPWQASCNARPHDSALSTQPACAHRRSLSSRWFQKSSEQFRIKGDLQLVGGDAGDAGLLAARKQTWGNLTDPGREQFFWPPPGAPHADGAAAAAAAAPGDDATPAGGRDAEGRMLPPPAEFLMVLLRPTSVKYLRLLDNFSQTDTLRRDGPTPEWAVARVNP